MTREEHIGKHPETNSDMLRMLFMAELMTPNLSRQRVVNFINGFN